MEKMIENQKEYYLSTKDEKDDYVIYSSESFKLSEIDIINLIKILIIEARSKSIGKKVLEMYKDSTAKRKQITQERLLAIGIKEKENEQPTRVRKTSTK